MYDAVLDVIAEAHMSQMNIRDREFEHRRQWHELRAIATLERALNTARSRFATATTKFSQAR